VLPQGELKKIKAKASLAMVPDHDELAKVAKKGKILLV